ncbi:hypothetical protein B0H17DRAFT_1201713 [Mycena rosella]|uniref:Uncharacterized protein n=1 Tax=Mycena rosella TaxID=1033263 RepID=A0AAD7GIA0_MYCRO|nr:hypothetical protein B0H17DRAFT_1201713 [Mycena rosella]
MDPPCITANSGIGVRTAIYAQNLLCFMPVWAYLRDGTVSPDEMKCVKDQSIGMLAIAFAILISTIIQAITAADGQPITGFHVAVILDLSWMNNTSTWICEARIEPGRELIPATWSAWVPVVRSKACHRHVRAESHRLVLAFHPVVVFHLANHVWDLFVFHIVDRLWDLFSRAPVLMFGSFHLSLMSAIGIWL